MNIAVHDPLVLQLEQGGNKLFCHRLYLLLCKPISISCQVRSELRVLDVFHYYILPGPNNVRQHFVRVYDVRVVDLLHYLELTLRL